MSKGHLACVECYCRLCLTFLSQYVMCSHPFIQREAACLKDFLKRREVEEVAASFRESVSPLRGNSSLHMDHTQHAASLQTNSNLPLNCVLENSCRPQRATSVHEDSWGADSRGHGFFPAKMSSHDTLRFYSPAMVSPSRPFQVPHQTCPWPGPPCWREPRAPWSPLPSWASSVVGLTQGLNAPRASPSMAGPSGLGLMPVRGAESVEVMPPSGTKCLPQELDIKPGKTKYERG